MRVCSQPANHQTAAMRVIGANTCGALQHSQDWFLSPARIFFRKLPNPNHIKDEYIQAKYEILRESYRVRAHSLKLLLLLWCRIRAQFLHLQQAKCSNQLLHRKLACIWIQFQRFVEIIEVPSPYFRECVYSRNNALSIKIVSFPAFVKCLVIFSSIFL